MIKSPNLPYRRTFRDILAQDIIKMQLEVTRLARLGYCHSNFKQRMDELDMLIAKFEEVKKTTPRNEDV